MYKLLAISHLGKPAIGGHGGGTIPKDLRLKIIDNPTFAYDSESYGYIDVTSIENYSNEAFDNVIGRDYLFVRDRIVELIEQKAYDACLSTLNDPATVTPSEGDCYKVGENPLGVLEPYSGAIAQWDGSAYQFSDPDVFGYHLCTDPEKEIAARLYIGLISDHKTQFGAEETFTWRKEYHERATANRYDRMHLAESLTEEELPAYTGYILFHLMSKVRTLKNNQVAQLDFHKLYKDIGVKGTLEERQPVRKSNGEIGIIDWFFGRDTEAYDFSGEGLINMPFQPANMTMNQFCDRINEILVLGG